MSWWDQLTASLGFKINKTASEKSADTSNQKLANILAQSNLFKGFPVFTSGFITYFLNRKK